MEEDFVTYEQAVKLKRLGFDWKCRYFYESDNKVLMPLEEIVSAIEGHDFCITSDTLMEDFNKQQDICSAPTLAQVQKWLREVKNIYVFSNKAIAFPDTLKGKFYWEIINKDLEVVDRCLSCDLTDTYEQSLSIGISKAIEILKQENNGK